ncbi:MAG TPA: 16S rRNA (cytosine(967)-C(5))-methyltransferase RsmB, partial [Gammaproteobacteria bacterium]|nr:16S rRNA (cytosine(967)-C(5))-methyltransferase RsmB [Gammaproteobacteria bacterium]
RRWASGLANGVLRRFLRERESLVQAALEQPSAHYLLQDWLLGKLRKAWPDSFEDLAAALAEPAPMTLRVDLSRVERDVYLQRLDTEGIRATPHVSVPSAIVLQSPGDIRQLPGFEEGEVSVQDAAAQLAGWLLDLKPGLRVLDACAAPGGKTVHILEQTGGGAEVVAVEYERSRIDRLEENLQRSGYPARVLVADAGHPDGWWDGVPYDRILLDAPCSATGVIRRHPDIKRHRQPDDIPALVEQQTRLLENLWPLLQPGGLLLYATCSILPEENTAQVKRFLAAHDDCREVIIEADWGHAVAAGRQILPGDDAMDGFFYALLGKNDGAPDGQVKTVN